MTQRKPKLLELTDDEWQLEKTKLMSRLRAAATKAIDTLEAVMESENPAEARKTALDVLAFCDMVPAAGSQKGSAARDLSEGVVLGMVGALRGLANMYGLPANNLEALQAPRNVTPDEPLPEDSPPPIRRKSHAAKTSAPPQDSEEPTGLSEEVLSAIRREHHISKGTK